MNHENDLKQVVNFYESLTEESILRLSEIYSTDAFFKDPFNEVMGLAEIARVFRRMYVQVDAPRFVVTTRVVQDNDAFMTWNFLFRMKRFSEEEQCVRGATHFRFSEDGKVNFHRDYWDVAEELYEKIPLLGGLMRVLKRKARH